MKITRILSLTLLVLVGVTLFVPPSPVLGEEDLSPEDEWVPWALMVDEGSGGVEDIDVGGRSIQVVRIPISYTLRSLDDHRHGLRFTLPVSFGFHELTADVVQEGQVVENLSTITVLPGLEWIVALPGRGVVKPFGEIGFSSDLDNSESVGVYSVGARLLRPVGDLTSRIQIGAMLRYSGSSFDGAAESDTILTGEFGIERQYGIGLILFGETTSLGIHGLVHHNFTRIRLKELDTTTTVLNRTALELGVSLGTENDVKVWGMSLPRIGLSYRSSGSFKSWRINFGFPF